MTAIGFAVAWAGYAVFMLGYCWLRDYNVTVPDLLKAQWPGGAQHTDAVGARTQGAKTAGR